MSRALWTTSTGSTDFYLHRPPFFSCKIWTRTRPLLSLSLFWCSSGTGGCVSFFCCSSGTGWCASSTAPPSPTSCTASSPASSEFLTCAVTCWRWCCWIHTESLLLSPDIFCIFLPYSFTFLRSLVVLSSPKFWVGFLGIFFWSKF